MPDFFLDEKCQNTVHASQYAVLSKGQAASSQAPAAAPAESTKKSSDSSDGKSISSDSEIGKLINVIKGAITEEIVQKTKAIFLFNIIGEQ